MAYAHSAEERELKQASPATALPAAAPAKEQQDDDNAAPSPYYFARGLRKVHPYNHTYLTYAKERWLGREILEVFTTEFRDRSADFYAWAIDNGTVMVNGRIVARDYVLINGDLIQNLSHRHEPPIIAGRIKIFHRDTANGVLVVEKKASMPIHATGRYKNNTLLEVLKNEEGMEVASTSNRLDRLVSGIMIIATNRATAQRLGKDFQTPGRVKKEYVARVFGKFPHRPWNGPDEQESREQAGEEDDIGRGEEVICEAPILCIDKQIGVNVVHPTGRPCKTIFRRLSYDPETDTSVVSCQPVTGRTHQLRVHLQYLGHSIANDPIYGNEKAWGNKRAKGGIFGPADMRPVYLDSPAYLDVPASPTQAADDLALAASLDVSAQTSPESSTSATPLELDSTKPLSALRLPDTSVDDDVAAALDASLFTAGKDHKNRSRYERRVQKKESYQVRSASRTPDQKPPGYNSRNKLSEEIYDPLGGGSEVSLIPEAVAAILHLRKVRDEEDNFARYRDMDRPAAVTSTSADTQEGFSLSDRLNGGVSMSAKKGTRIGMMDRQTRDAISAAENAVAQRSIRHRQLENPDWFLAYDEKGTYCKVCGLPLLPDPEPKNLEIWLHAMRYRTDDWDYASPLPEWAQEDWRTTEAYRRSGYVKGQTFPEPALPPGRVSV